MRKWLLYLLPLLLLPLDAQAAPVLTQWGQDPSGTNRNVYVLDPTDSVFVSIGSFNTSTDTFTLGAANLPLPTASTLGGVFSSSAPANQFATGINTSGAVTYAQPSFANLSGAIASGQISGSTITTSLGYTPVNKAGDTMTGNLTLAFTTPSLVMNASGTSQATIQFQQAGSNTASIGTNSSDTYFENDNATGNLFLTIISGNMTIGETGKAITSNDNINIAPASGTATITLTGASGQNAAVNLNAASGHTAQVLFQLAGVNGYQWYENANVFHGQDLISGGTPDFFQVSSGNLTIGEGGSATVTTQGTLDTSQISSNVGIISTNPSNYWLFAINESWVGGTAFGTPFVMQDIMSNGGTGNRNVATITMLTGYGGSGLNYVGIQENAVSCGTNNTGICAGQNGGGTGHFFGSNPYVLVFAGSATTTEAVGEEADTDIRTAVTRKVGIQIIDISTSTSSGSSFDAGLMVDAQGGAVGYSNAIQVNSAGIKSGGNAISTPGGYAVHADGSTSSKGYQSRSGTSGSFSSNYANLFWNGSNTHLWMDTTDLGQIAFTSDERLKNMLNDSHALTSDKVINIIKNINAFAFTYKHDTSQPDGVGHQIYYGVGAHALNDIAPDLVRNTGMITPDTPDGLWTVDYNSLFMVGLLATQKNTNDIAALQAAVAALQAGVK